MSTGKGKATYLYMEQNSKDTNKIFLGENMKNCNIFFFYRKKISPMTWFYSNNSIYTRVGENNKLKPFIICISIKNISITGNKKKNK